MGRKKRNSAPSTSDRPQVNRAPVRFLLVFALIVGAYYLLTVIPWVDRNLIYPVLELTARSTSWLMNLGGAETVVRGVTIQGPDFAVRVQRGCDPIEPIVLFGAAVAAFPASLRHKLLGLVSGAVILLTLNQVRIISLYFVGKSRASWFYSLHQEWWPAGFILAALLLWLAWLGIIRARPGDRHA